MKTLSGTTSPSKTLLNHVNSLQAERLVSELPGDKEVMEAGGVQKEFSWLDKGNGMKKIMASLLAAEDDNQVERHTTLLDSRANGHIFNSRKYFDEFISFTQTVDTADQTTNLLIEGGGNVPLVITNRVGEQTALTLTEVVFSTDAFCNLVSMSLLGKRGYLKGTWDEKEITLET
jgi:hypothetical protein